MTYTNNRRQQMNNKNSELFEKAPKRDNWPLTFPERQMATEQSLDPDSVAYNINVAIGISGKVDTKKLNSGCCLFLNHIFHFFSTRFRGQLFRE